jgi:serine/threonine-protein kinase
MGFVVGTPEYMSPEQLMGEPLDGRSDVYSLGLVLFRMLAGGLPFRAETTQEIMIQRLTHAPLKLNEAKPDSAFPARLQAALDRALERKATDRWASAEEFEQELEAIATEAAGVPVSPARPRETVHFDAAAREEIAPTRVAAIPDSAHTAPAGAAAAASRSRMPWALVAAGALVVVAGVAGALSLTGADAESGNAPADSAAQVIVPPAPDITASNPTRDPAPPVTDAGGRAATATEPQGVSRPEPPPPGPAPLTIAPDRAGDVLFQQLDLLGATPDDRTLTAVLDTARAVYAMRSLPERDRALAAYVIGSAYDMRREWTLCFQWVDSALVLQPGGAGFAELRGKCRELAR